ncbi:MAG: autotransporter assembly complex family protein [Pseudomonadota bacterium]
MGKRSLTNRFGQWLVASCLVFFVAGERASALDRVILRVPEEAGALRETLENASLVVSADREGRDGPQEVFAAALSDYARLLETLYSEGYYSGVISILVDGREAASIPLLSTPRSISIVDIRINPGPPFQFGQTQIAPLPPGTPPVPDLRPGGPAKAGFVRAAVADAVEAWRLAGYAKARVGGETVKANHREATLDTLVTIAPGPRARFGELVIETPSQVRASAIRRIAGLPQGAPFSPETVDEVAQRLRRAGAFTSVSLQEADQLGADNSLDMLLSVTDQKPRRLGFGVELSSLDGLALSGFWLHRNIFGGAERLRFDASVSNIGGSNGIDWSLGARIETPAPYGADTRAFAFVTLEHLDEPTFQSDTLSLGVGAGWRISDRLEVELALAYNYGETEDAFGTRTFSYISLPGTATYDTRDNALDATEGLFLQAELTPFLGIDDAGSGLRSYADARAYRALGERLVVAGRLQFGSIVGAEIREIDPDFLFFSGGAGTVRGHPFNSLDVTLPGGLETGGRALLVGSAELRALFTDSIGGVVFADAGYVGAETFYDGSGEWHVGAGIGLRYQTGLGPIRFDVALPVSGDTDEGVQVYLGIGQAF